MRMVPDFLSSTEKVKPVQAEPYKATFRHLTTSLSESTAYSTRESGLPPGKKSDKNGAMAFV